MRDPFNSHPEELMKPVTQMTKEQLLSSYQFLYIKAWCDYCYELIKQKQPDPDLQETYVKYVGHPTAILVDHMAGRYSINMEIYYYEVYLPIHNTLFFPKDIAEALRDELNDHSRPNETLFYKTLKFEEKHAVKELNRILEGNESMYEELRILREQLGMT